MKIKFGKGAVGLLIVLAVIGLFAAVAFGNVASKEPVGERSDEDSVVGLEHQDSSVAGEDTDDVEESDANEVNVEENDSLAVDDTEDVGAIDETDVQDENATDESDIITVPQPDLSAPVGPVSREAAIKIASSYAEGSVTAVESERVSGILAYSIEVTKDGFETDVKIERATGRVLRIEKDKTRNHAD
jgi:uncharacterized membrane protein YkoI